MKKKVNKQNTHNSIGYSGKVSVRVVSKRGTEKILRTHNEGQSLLFKFIANCLANSYSEREAPRYIRLFAKNGGDVDYAHPLTDAIPYAQLNTQQIEKSGEYYWTTSFTFVVPGNIFSSSEDVSCIAMYSREGLNISSGFDTNALAIVNLKTDVSHDIESNVIVVWSMTIGNDIYTAEE